MIIKLKNGSGKEVSRGDRDGMQRKNMCAGREVRCRGAGQQSSISESEVKIWRQRNSEGLIVPLEDERQQNDIRGK